MNAFSLRVAFPSMQERYQKRQKQILESGEESLTIFESARRKMVVPAARSAKAVAAHNAIEAKGLFSVELHLAGNGVTLVPNW